MSRLRGVTIYVMPFNRKYGIHIIRKNVQDGLAIIVKVYDTFLLVTAFHTLHSKTFLL